MARFDGIFFSKELSRPTHFVAILSNDNAMGTPDTPYYKRPTKNVYLLHGYSGCDTDWASNAALGELANKYNLPVLVHDRANGSFNEQSGVIDWRDDTNGRHWKGISY